MEPIKRNRSLVPIEVEGTAKDRRPYAFHVLLVNKGVGMSKMQQGLLQDLFYLSHDDAYEAMSRAHLNGTSKLMKTTYDIAETKTLRANWERRNRVALDPSLAGVAFAMEQSFDPVLN